MYQDRKGMDCFYCGYMKGSIRKGLDLGAQHPPTQPPDGFDVQIKMSFRFKPARDVNLKQQFTIITATKQETKSYRLLSMFFENWCRVGIPEILQTGRFLFILNIISFPCYGLLSAVERSAKVIQKLQVNIFFSLTTDHLSCVFVMVMRVRLFLILCFFFHSIIN